VLSLRALNREILKKNNIDDHVDDFIFLSLKMEKPILPASDTVVPPKPTPCQLKLPFALGQRDVLLLCKEGTKDKCANLVHDCGFGSFLEVREVSKNMKPSDLAGFDLWLVQEGLKLGPKFLRRR
jgi:hypothetical protein